MGQDPVGELLIAHRAARALLAAVEMNLFQHVENSTGIAADVAQLAGVDARAAEIVLDALAAAGFLTKKGVLYANTPYSRTRLCETSPGSLVNNLRYQGLLSRGLDELTSTIREGRPKYELRRLIAENPKFVETYIRGMQEIAQGPSREMARRVNLRRAQSLIDIGAGAGTFGLAFLEKKPELSVVMLDLPETLEYTKRFTAESPYAARIEFRPADYHAADFGRARFDVAIASHTTHDDAAEENARLFEKTYAALAPGGLFVVHDFMLSDDGTFPLFGALFSVHLMTYTLSGRAYRESNYREWLSRAGFRKCERHLINKGLPNETVMLVARKAD
jgi:ubiquinone/menaquinone biosynthesis C-methylase UbiE